MCRGKKWQNIDCLQLNCKNKLYFAANVVNNKKYPAQSFGISPDQFSQLGRQSIWQYYARFRGSVLPVFKLESISMQYNKSFRSFKRKKRFALGKEDDITTFTTKLVSV